MIAQTMVEHDERQQSLHAAHRLLLRGAVQGLGVRPAVFRLATELQLGGTVRNTARGVEIEIEGPHCDLEEFERSLLQALPQGTMLEQLATESVEPRNRKQFAIVKESTDEALQARAPEDRALCDECGREISREGDRRFRYPLTSCTRCGPRYSVIRSMPFEREDTSLADFPLCPDCRHEYERPRDRRFHAQTTACPKCGPQVWCSIRRGERGMYGEQALLAALAHLRAGRIVAMRGIGGYQLLVDATNQVAVSRLRDRKGRRSKPLAVMVESLTAAEQLAYMDTAERNAFSDPSAPIVLLRAKAAGTLAASVNPHVDTIGLMRPTSPLHLMLTRDFGRPLVCTSGNRDGEPLEYTVNGAEQHLAGIADVWLHHDREITRPIDDSVVRVIAGRRVTIRLARGLAPLALDLPMMPPTMAVGGYLKAAAAWSNGAQSVLGPHIGDQETIAARERFIAALSDSQSLYRFQRTQIVCDLHPDYFSTQWAEASGLPCVSVQHHHAHVVAGMLEHGWLDRTVLGVAWDGTGYGTDGTIWGGEFLKCTAASFERVARLRPFQLPGGEAAIREPWRIAVAICRQIGEHIDLRQWPGWSIDAERVKSVRSIADKSQLSPTTSSVGRLFDAAAALVLGLTHVDFDGEAPMQLEAIADESTTGSYEMPLIEGEPAELDWRPLFAQLLDDCRNGVDPGIVSMRFHRSLAAAIVRVCRKSSTLPVVLSGGVFQNRLLTELVVGEWDIKSQSLALPGIIPPNDGGLAAGQLAIAAAKGGWLPCV